MVFWFVGPSVLLVWLVFRSPSADYRVVALGSLVPLLELPVGEPRLLHSLLAPVAVMALVMVGFRGRRLTQRRWLGLPIGMLFHLVLDGGWTDTDAFWWPALGGAWSTAELPEVGRGPVNVLFEAAGLAVCAWLHRRFRLREPDRRADLVRTGRVGRDIVPR